MVVEELVAKLGFSMDGTGLREFTHGLDEAQGKLEEFGAMGAAAIGAAVVAIGVGLTALTAHVATETAEMNELAESVGLTAEKFQELSAVATFTGASQEKLATGVRILSSKLDEAANGGKQAVQLFHSLGVATKDSSGNVRTAGDVMGDVSAKFAGMEASAKRTHLAVQLFGRSGTALIPMLTKSAEETQGLIQKARDLGAIMSGEDVESLKKFHESLNVAGMAVAGLQNKIALAFLPYAQKMSTALNNLWEKLAPKLIPAIQEVVRVIGSAFIGALKTAEFALKQMWSAVEALGDVLAMLGVNLNALKGPAIAIGAILFAAFAPVTAAVAGLFLLFDDLNVYMHGGKSVIGLVIDWLAKLSKSLGIDWANNAFVQGIKNWRDELNLFITSTEIAVKLVGKLFDAINGDQKAFSLLSRVGSAALGIDLSPPSASPRSAPAAQGPSSGPSTSNFAPVINIVAHELARQMNPLEFGKFIASEVEKIFSRHVEDAYAANTNYSTAGVQTTGA
jgi:minor tail protein